MTENAIHCRKAMPKYKFSYRAIKSTNFMDCLKNMYFLLESIIKGSRTVRSSFIQSISYYLQIFVEICLSPINNIYFSKNCIINEYLFIAAYYRQLSIDSKMKNYIKINLITQRIFNRFQTHIGKNITY